MVKTTAKTSKTRKAPVKPEDFVQEKALVNPRKIQVDEIVSETTFMKCVATMDRNQDIRFSIDGDPVGSDPTKVSATYVKNHMQSSNYFEKKVPVSRTILNHIIQSNTKTAMTIGYNTKLKEEDIAAQFASLPVSVRRLPKSELEKEIKKRIELKGTFREIKGIHYGRLDAHQRLKFIDMMEPYKISNGYDTRTRLVDLRQSQYCIVNGIYWYVK